MINKLLNGKSITFIAGLLLIVLPVFCLLYAQGTAVMRVNRIFSGVVDNGGQGDFNYSGGWFPADYDCIGCGMREELGIAVTGGSIITMARNWKNPKTGDIIPYAVIKPSDNLSLGEVTEPIENYIRYSYPQLKIDWTDYTLNDFGVVDHTKLVGTSDQTVTVTYRNDMGVEIKRTIFAWGQQYHDDYIVVDLVLTNASDDTLKDFWVALYNSWAYWDFAKGDNPDVDIYGNIGGYMLLDWCHYYGSRPGDSLRVWYLYQADHPTQDGDQMGLPVYTQDGRLLTCNMLYYTILHASKEPYENDAQDINDPLQPRATSAFSDFVMKFNWGDIKAREHMYKILTGEYWANSKQLIEDRIPGTFHRINNDEQGSPDFRCIEGFSIQSPWHKAWSGFGPYKNFAPGQKIHIVYATGIQGLRLKKEKWVGERWLNETLENPPELPNDETGYFPENFAFPEGASEMDKIKDRWISTVIDSIHKSCSRIKWNYEHNWQIPGSPPPPDSVITTGYGDGVEIKWSCFEAEAKEYFYGYRILKKIGRMDTVFYELAKFLPKDSLELGEVHAWKDTNILFGASYYYYVQTGYVVNESHPNYSYAYPETKGKILWSNRLWVPNLIPVKPPRPPQDDLNKIVIAPNPYNIKDPLLGGYGVSDEGYRLIMFFNLPPVCKIRIYSESGDLVKTIIHDSPSRTGMETWDMLNDNQQAISSGVYIVVFEKPNGEVSYQKLVVVR